MAKSKRVRPPVVQLVLSGQPVQQIAVSDYVVNIGAVQGAVINFAAPGERAADRIHLRREPPHCLPRLAPDFLDREQEQRCVGQALARGQLVDLHGPDGIGKTTLIGQVMRIQLSSTFPHGMVYHSARRQTLEDLQQDLFEIFFETDGKVKISENDFHRYMAGKRALIAVDDANHLGEGEAEALAQAIVLAENTHPLQKPTRRMDNPSGLLGIAS